MTGNAPGHGAAPERPGATRDTHDLRTAHELDEELDAVVSECLGEAVQATGAYSGVAYLRSPDHRSLVLVKVAGLAISLLDAWVRLPVTGALPVPEAFRTGRTVFLADDGDTMRRFPQLALGTPYPFASAATPVRVGAETFGALCVMWPARPGRGLPSSQRRGLRTAAKHLGDALAKAARRGVRVEYDGPPTETPLLSPAFPLIRVGLFDWNVATDEFDADDELCELFGIDPAAYDRRSSTLAARVVSGGGRAFRAAARRAAETGRVLAWRFQVLGADGVRRPLEVWGRVADSDFGGRSRHLVGAVLDLGTGAAAAEAMERLHDGVFSLDPDGRITYVNRNLENLLDVHLHDVLGKTPWEALSWLADPSYEDRYRAAMLSQRPSSFLARAPRDRWFAFALYPDPFGVTGKVVPVGEPADVPADVPAMPQGPVGFEAADRVISAGPEGDAIPLRPGAIYHILQMAGALAEAVSVDAVCKVVADQILPAFGGQEIAIYIVRNKRFFLARQAGYREGFLDRFEGVPLDASLPGVEALTRGVPIFFESPDALSEAYPGIPLDEMCAWAFLPLIASDRPVGSCILGFDQRHVFTPEERSVLTALSGLVAQALERARLYDAEFALARGLQDALLPHRLPSLPRLEVAARYLPGTKGMEIGGDWYDVIDTGSAVALVIGDVEGHNVAAAATMGQLRSAVRAFATGGQEPDGVVQCTNRLLADLDTGLFASCCYLELDPHTGVVEMVRAGHPPPLLCGADGRSRVVEVAGGTLLGVDRFAEYPVTRLSLEPGSVLALYTDGLVEDVGVDIDHGIDRMCASLSRAHDASLSALADRMLGDAGRLKERADDVAILLTRWT